MLDYRRSHSLLSEPLQLACYHKQNKIIVLCCTGKAKTINLHNFRLAAFTLQCNKVMLYHIEEYFHTIGEEFYPVFDSMTEKRQQHGLQVYNASNSPLGHLDSDV